MTRPSLRRGEADTLIRASALLDALESRQSLGTATIDCPTGNHSHEVDIDHTVDLDWLYDTIEDLIREENA